MPQLASRIIQEGKAGQPASSDLFIGSENHVARMNLKSSSGRRCFPHITRPMVDWDGKVMIVVSRTPGLTYNTTMVRADEVPQRVEDLLNPKWKGKIASTPYAASFDRLALIWGEEKSTAFLQKFAKQVAGLIRCGEEERVLNGEFAMMAFNCDLGGRQRHARERRAGQWQDFQRRGDLSYWYLAVPKQLRSSQCGVSSGGVYVDQRRTGYSLEDGEDQLALGRGTNMFKFVKDQERQGVKFYANPSPTS